MSPCRYGLDAGRIGRLFQRPGHPAWWRQEPGGTVMELDIPLVYRDGYGKAVILNPDIAANYVGNTTVGDTLADAVVETLASLPAQEISRVMNSCMNRNAEPLPNTPPEVIDFIESLSVVPSWFDDDAALPGRLALHRHMDLFIIGLFYVSLQNFNSLMSRVFFLTGEGTTQQGLRVIRQNMRYLTQALILPQALDPWEEGWKFSIRIRLVHARVRRRLRNSGQWDEIKFGVPVSAANMALTSANFSASLIRNVDRLGADLSDCERFSIMQIWRYASWLMGTPDTLLCGGDENAAAELSRIGHICEPAPDATTTVIANAMIGLLPEVANLTDPAEKRAMIKHGYRLSRALLGDEFADRLGFPRMRTAGLLPLMRLRNRLQKMSGHLAPAIARFWKDDPFLRLLDAAMITGLRGQLPDELKAAKARAAANKRS